jgi:histidine triad (HIT) family protein
MNPTSKPPAVKAASPPTNPGCLFCKIISGQIPCCKLYEDDRVLAFLDIGPLSRGHSLIIPKAHYQTIDQLPSEWAAACASVFPRLSSAIKAVTGVTAWNILQNNGEAAGQAVGHVHFHVIPRSEGDGLGYRWPAGKLDPQEASILVKAIAARL